MDLLVTDSKKVLQVVQVVSEQSGNTDRSVGTGCVNIQHFLYIKTSRTSLNYKIYK
jgi:hypothetical protein